MNFVASCMEVDKCNFDDIIVPTAVTNEVWFKYNNILENNIYENQLRPTLLKFIAICNRAPVRKVCLRTGVWCIGNIKNYEMCVIHSKRLTFMNKLKQWILGTIKIIDQFHVGISVQSQEVIRQHRFIFDSI